VRKRVDELIGAELDYAVAASVGITYQGCTEYNGIGMEFPAHAFSTDWGQGGPIIEREGISVEVLHEGDGWCACIGCTPHDFLMLDQPYASNATYAEGPTPLIATMRCFVAECYGDEIEIPDSVGERK
jgi:hypothetical protein